VKASNQKHTQSIEASFHQYGGRYSVVESKHFKSFQQFPSVVQATKHLMEQHCRSSSHMRPLSI